MPKGPRGEKRPADTNACAVKVAKIATGEVEETKYVAPGRKKSGEAGAAIRAKRLTGERRSEIARMAAAKRWSPTKEVGDMSNKTAQEHDSSRGDRAVLMYPNNDLKDQVRDYDDTFSVATVLKETFFPDTG